MLFIRLQVLSFLLLITAPALCQVSVGTQVVVDVFNPSGTFSQFSEIECHKNNFWSLNSLGDIYEWSITNGVVNFVDTIMIYSPISSIAFCDSMNISTIPTTFYGSNGIDLYFYDGANWNNLMSPSLSWIGNCGAHQNFLFYTAVSNGSTHNNLAHEIYRFDGISLTLVASLAVGRNFSIADIAVDENGNILILSGVGIMTDTLLKFSAAGTLLGAYPFSLDCTHAYGSFMQNGVYYIGLGSYNPLFPNKLLSIGTSGNSGIILDTIPFSNSDYFDLAGCNPGTLLSSKNNLPVIEAFQIFPNPVTSHGYIFVPSEFSFPLSINIFDCNGRTAWVGEIDSQELKMIDQLSAGVYFVEIVGTNLKLKLVRLNER